MQNACPPYLNHTLSPIWCREWKRKEKKKGQSTPLVSLCEYGVYEEAVCVLIDSEFGWEQGGLSFGQGLFKYFRGGNEFIYQQFFS